MQTINFVRTAKWVIEQYTEETKDVVLRSPWRLIEKSGQKERGIFIRAAMEIAVVCERLNFDQHAPSLLRAFGLEDLLDRELAVKIAEITPDELRQSEEGAKLTQLSRRWFVFEHCLGPIEKLTIPAAVAEEKDYDDILTLELLYEGERHPKAETVAEVLQNASLLYSSISRGLRQPEYPPLVVIYADSGSDVRFDLSGLGEPIKELKGFLVELWNRLRHRRADDYRANAEALLGGLTAVAGLEALHQQGAISGEDVARYKRDILESGIRLFESGTLPREVPRVESVGNQRLLVEIQRKLLPPAPEPPTPEGVSKQTRNRGRKRTRSRSAKRR